MVATVSSRDAVIAGIGRSDFLIIAARRNSLFLTSAEPRPNVRKRDPRYIVHATIFIAIVMVAPTVALQAQGLLMWAVVSGYLMVLTVESTGA